MELEEDDEIEAFADDIRLEIFGFPIEELQDNANKELAELTLWVSNNKLEINETKTECVLFTKNLKNNKPKIFLNNKELSISNSFKHLGLITDSRLSWRRHANYLKAKATQLTMNLLSFVKQKFGLNSKAPKSSTKELFCL
jgi:hypothetical protein